MVCSWLLLRDRCEGTNHWFFWQRRLNNAPLDSFHRLDSTWRMHLRSLSMDRCLLLFILFAVEGQEPIVREPMNLMFLSGRFTRLLRESSSPSTSSSDTSSLGKNLRQCWSSLVSKSFTYASKLELYSSPLRSSKVISPSSPGVFHEIRPWLLIQIWPLPSGCCSILQVSLDCSFGQGLGPETAVILTWSRPLTLSTKAP